ncbi:MAG: SpoIID/LytB domain-containing protein [Phycisphaerales bacterium]|nr:SpoIID/LytB domain-containing protein [Phycisphaerales bacterium]
MNTQQLGTMFTRGSDARRFGGHGRSRPVAAWAGAVAITLMAGCSGSGISNPFESGSSSTAKAPARTTPVATPPRASTSETPIPRAIVPGVAGEPEIRVRLSAGVGSLKVGSTGGLVWVTALGSERPPARMVAPVSVKVTSLGWEVSDAAGLTGRFDRQAELRLLAQANGVVEVASARGKVLASGAGSAPGVSTKAGATLTVEGRRYPGALAMSARSDIGMWAFDVISQVGVEEYIKGVVAAEMFASWPLDAYSAQAVAARSYALHERQRARLSGARFDVESTVSDQAYKGVELAPQVAQAVEETRGVVLTWNGSVLRAYYHSTSGGRAASAKDTWPTSRGFEYNLGGPLQATPREETGQTSPYFRWTVSRTRADVSARLRQWGKVNGQTIRELGSITQVLVSERNTVGRPTRFAISDSSGRTFVITGEQLRQACNASVTGFSGVVRENRVNSSDMEWQIIGDVVTIRGRGFGHGVGMCQYSAKELAARGVDWRAILNRFYGGAKIERAY